LEAGDLNVRREAGNLRLDLVFETGKDRERNDERCDAQRNTGDRDERQE